MTAHAEFAYAQARLQARHGLLPQATVWQALEASRTAGHYLALARSGPMAEWIEGLDDASDTHRIERHLRARWRRHVDAVARWLPQRWQPAVRWFGTLSDLALIDALQRGGHASNWLHLDEHLATFQLPDPATRAQALRASGLAVFAAPDKRGLEGDVVARWLDQWTRLLPPDADAPALLRQPAELLLPRMLDAGAARAANAESTRRALVRLFRRHAASAVAALAHLALVALDVERLRGGLAMRILFEVRPEPEGS